MLALHLGLLDADFTVSEPLELVEHLTKLGRRYVEASIDAAQ
jgi:hypothetical protein